MHIPQPVTAETITAIRIALGLTQNQLAQLLVVPEQTIDEWESGMPVPDDELFVFSLWHLTDDFLEDVARLRTGRSITQPWWEAAARFWASQPRFNTAPQRTQAKLAFAHELIDGGHPIWAGPVSDSLDIDEVEQAVSNTLIFQILCYQGPAGHLVGQIDFDLSDDIMVSQEIADWVPQSIARYGARLV